MARNKSADLAVLKRREFVSELYLRRYTLRQIVDALKTTGVRNLKTGAAFGLTTIHRDLEAVRKDWEDRASAYIDQRKAEMLAQLDEVKKKAWQSSDLPTVLRSIAQETDIVGAKAPLRTELTGSGGGPVRTEEVRDFSALTPREKMDLADLLRKAGAGHE